MTLGFFNKTVGISFEPSTKVANHLSMTRFGMEINENKWNQWTAINNSIKTKLRQKKNQKPNLRRSQFFSPGQNDTR